MVNLTTKKVSFMQNPVVTNSTNQDNFVTPEKKEVVNAKKLILPLSLIAGGGLLVYLGVRRPNVESVFKKIVKSNRADMDAELPTFYEYVENAISEFLEVSLQKIYQYKKNRLDKISERIDKPIDLASDAFDVMRRQNKAFKIIDTELNSYLQLGASESDDYIVKLFSDKRVLKEKLLPQQNKVFLKIKDKIKINTTDDFRKSSNVKIHDETLKKSEKELREYADYLNDKMGKFVNKKVDYSINLQSKIMENVIVEMRDLLKETKEKIIISAFEKISKMLNLNDFRPSYTNQIHIDGFSKLTKEELKPVQISNELSQMFEGNVYFDVIKQLDFNNLNEEILNKIFYSGTPFNNITDIKFLIDRLRLFDKVQKSKGIDNTSIHNNIIKKLEGLYLKLKDFGEKEFLSRCEQDFNSMSKDELRAKFYYMDRISRRLGYHALTQANRNFIRNYPQYSNTAFSKIAEKIRQYPEEYFI